MRLNKETTYDEINAVGNILLRYRRDKATNSEKKSIDGLVDILAPELLKIGYKHKVPQFNADFSKVDKAISGLK